ncbi:iron permease [Paenibacillus albiflavus]|uniref:Iron permease n=1 Tax=Paenibacillus albiflavus TaxID=2545760 RepID=A0A4R4EDG7_9BACL|nr:FTR1 family protein [Paenibacillus albiflavus]TCZ77769.1 iron permease [Paenibacillus albiflavus]
MLVNHQRYHFIMRILVLSLILLLPFQGIVRATPLQDAEKQLLPIVGGALVEAGQKNWAGVRAELEQLEAEWAKLSSLASSPDIDTALSNAKQAIDKADQDPEAASTAISALAKVMNEWVKAQQPEEAKLSGAEAAATFIPLIEKIQADVTKSNWTDARSKYKQFVKDWGKLESIIRSDNAKAYGLIETKSSLARISLQAEPPMAENASKTLTELTLAIHDYVNGQIAQDSSSTGSTSIRDLIDILDQAESSIASGQISEASDRMQSFISLWPSVEGQISTRSASTYTKIENQMAEAASYLVSSPPKTDKASSVIAAMKQGLEPYSDATSYTAWDAGLVLLREGVEALLVVATLLAFLHRTGNSSKQKWIWSGALTGLVASIGLAFLLIYAIKSVTAGSTRELIEGIAGLVSVALMLTVGVWLHSKANTSNWNQYIQGQIGSALASGKLWYLFIIAGISILREGAETIIFYIGMLPSMKISDFILGVGIALILLIILGFIVVIGSVRIPIRPFFLAATIFIYYLVIKFLGESIHALQVAGHVPAHNTGILPSISLLGIYPTWETLIPQLAVIIFIILQVIRVELKRKSSLSSN